MSRNGLVKVFLPLSGHAKRMKDFLGIQKDHAELINDCLKGIKAGGTLYFSTNFRKFVLDKEKINSSSIKDITKAIAPFDFEGRLHRYCFRIIK